jgi:spore maturation protein A
MLNKIWMSLLVIGILTAIGKDVADEINNPYRNGQAVPARFDGLRPTNADRTTWEGTIVLSAQEFTAFYGSSIAGEVRQPVRVIVVGSTVRGIVKPDDAAPEIWKTMAKLGTNKGQILATVLTPTMTEGVPSGGAVEFEAIRFVKLRAVTQAALDFANTAVEISIGLIGIMALWLGLIKIAEEAGLVLLLTRALRPITMRLFPEIPQDHPAIGSMIMNIAANMLGLSNAATPMGLKAMEELNKLNTKAGTATNAMCTFLVINTGGLILIPATAIAVRAAAGSVNPGIIIGTSIFGAGCATVAGVVAAKILQRLRAFRVEEGQKS